MLWAREMPCHKYPRQKRTRFMLLKFSLLTMPSHREMPSHKASHESRKTRIIRGSARWSVVQSAARPHHPSSLIETAPPAFLPIFSQLKQRLSFFLKEDKNLEMRKKERKWSMCLCARMLVCARRRCFFLQLFLLSLQPADVPRKSKRTEKLRQNLLRTAIEEENDEVAVRLVNTLCAGIDVEFEHGWLPTTLAIGRAKKLPLFIALCNGNGKVWKNVDANGRNGLVEAVRWENVDLIKKCLRLKVNPNTFCWSSLLEAFVTRNEEIVRLLLRTGVPCRDPCMIPHEVPQTMKAVAKSIGTLGNLDENDDEDDHENQSPRMLNELVRRKLRKHLLNVTDKNLLFSVLQLPLPKASKRFLLFHLDEYYFCEDECLELWSKMPSKIPMDQRNS